MKNLTVDTINTLSDHRNVIFHLDFIYAKVERKLIRFRKKNSSFPENLREELDDKFSITKMTVITLHFIPVLIVLQQNSSDILEMCMKNAALQLRILPLSKVNVVNGTTQILK